MPAVPAQPKKQARARRPAGTADPTADAVLEILREHARPMSAIAIKKALVARELLASDEFDQAWKTARQVVLATGRVRLLGRSYQWAAEAGREQPGGDPAREQALRRSVAELTARCAELERRLRERPSPPDDDRSTQLRTAQDRQLKIDMVRALAELAMEVEELAVNGVKPELLVHRVRARVGRVGLHPIDRAGEQTGFDRARHRPITGGIADGSPVYVVRPGYSWTTPDEDVLIGKALVEE